MEALTEQRLNCILLIDDNEFTNIFNRRFLEKMQVARQVFAVKTAEEGLDFLRRSGKYEQETYPSPELIFLDLNMPVMSGWEFAEEFEKLSPGLRNGKIFILTTSPNPEDEEKALTLHQISGYRRKPLTREMVLEILEQHFN